MKRHPQGRGRYGVIVELVEAIKPKSFIEVGVHEGSTAEKICRLGSSYSSADEPFQYRGFDLWEQLEDARKVFHGKGASTKQMVEDRLSKFDNLEFTLIQGDTAKTLEQNPNAEMAFIDGDHRDFAIQNDYDRVFAETVIFDDFYSPALEGLGCNNVMCNHKYAWMLESLDVHQNSFFKVPTRISLLIFTNDERMQSYLESRDDMRRLK